MMPAGRLGAARTVYQEFFSEAERQLLTPLAASAKITAVTLTSRHSGAVSDPVRVGPDVRVRSLKTEQYSSA